MAEDQETTEEETEETTEDQKEEIRNPAAKAKADEEATYRRRLREREAELATKDTELEELRKFRKEQEDADKSELEKAQGELEEVQATNEKLAKSIANNNLELSILKADDIGKFVKPQVVLKFVADYEPEIAKDGTITNIADILTSIAKDHPYLLASTSGDDDDENGGDNEEESGCATSSGSPFNKQKKGTKPDRGKLEELFPALRGR